MKRDFNVALMKMGMAMDGRAIELGPGEMPCIPRGAVHRFDNFGQSAAKSLCAISPAAIGPEYFREVKTLLDAAAGGQEDRAQMTAVMLKHGLTHPCQNPEKAEIDFPRFKMTTLDLKLRPN